MNQQKKTGTTARFWILLWSLGLAGQICWNIENQWFNTFIYEKIAKDSNIVTVMVISSALITTISTFIFGTLSDRIGKRRKFVSIGYICWGVCTILFGLTEYITNGQVGANTKYTLLAAVLVIVADDIMSFFGSVANDSGFSSWSNDWTNDSNRGQIGAVLAVLPVIGTILGTIVGGLLIGDNNNYQMLFWVMGLFVIANGVISLIFLKDHPSLAPSQTGTFRSQFIQVFRIKDLLKRRELLMACLTSTIFFVSFNTYFTHLGNWIIYRMGFTAGDMGLVEGLGLLLASFLVIPAIKLINNNKTPILTFAAIIINFIGVIYIYFTINPATVDTTQLFCLTNLPLFVGVFLVGAGYILITQSLTMWVKELYPEEAKAQFEGVRIVFFVLLPMFGGTILGNIIIKNGAGTIINDYGITENIPTESIFGWAALVVLFAFIPLLFGAKDYFKRKKKA